MTLIKNKPTLFSLILVNSIWAQTAYPARDPVTIVAPDCGACFCTMQLGQSGPISTPNNDNDLIAKFDPLKHNLYKKFHFWSKNELTQGVKIDMTTDEQMDGDESYEHDMEDAYGDEGQNRDEDSSANYQTPGFDGGTGHQNHGHITYNTITGLQIEQVKWRFSVQSPYQLGCNIRLTMDDGIAYSDASTSVGDQGCSNYAEETAVFTQKQFVFSFFSYSHNTDTLKSPSYLGINYYQCLCRNIQISIPAIQNMKASVLGQAQSQTIVLDFGLFDCTPIVVSISPTVSWLTYSYTHPDLTISISSSNAADISSQIFTVTAQYSNVAPTTKTFNAEIEACKITSASLITGVQSFQYTITPTANVVTFTPTYQFAPACPSVTSELTLTTNFTNTPFIQISGSSIQISTSDRTLHNQNVLVTYIYTPNSQTEVSVSSYFVVTLYSPCQDATISGQSMTAMTYMLFDPLQSQSVTYADTYSTLVGQQGYCGALKTNLTWSFGQVQTLPTGSITLSVSSSNISSVGSYLVYYVVYLEEFSTIKSTFYVQITIDSTCPNTQIVQQSLQPMVVQIGSLLSQQFQEFTDILSMFHSDGLSYCQQREYSLSPSASFLSLQGTKIVVNPNYLANKGIYDFSLIVGLVTFTTVPTISAPFQVTILDCKQGIVLPQNQFNATTVRILGETVTQTVILSDDNFQLCGSYEVFLSNPEPWLSFYLQENVLNATIQLDDLKIIPKLYEFQWYISFSEHNNPLQLLSWSVSVVDCVACRKSFQPPIDPVMANLTENFELYSGLKDWNYWLPKVTVRNSETTDLTELQLNVSVNIPPNCVIQEVRKDDQIGLELVKPLTFETLGEFTISVALSFFDTQTVRHSTQYKIKFAIVNSVNKTDQWKPNTVNTSQTNLAKIVKLDATGLLVIGFSEPVLLNETFKSYFQEQQNLGNPIVDIKILPGEYSEVQRLNLEWQLTQTENSTISFRLKFEKPQAVSSFSSNPDRLLVLFLRPDIFTSTLNHSLSTRQLSKVLQTQWSSSAQRMAKGVTSTLQSTMVLALSQNIIVNLILGGSLEQLWQLVEGLQIVLHMTLFKIGLPQNVISFTTTFINFATLNLVPTNLLTDRIFTENATEPLSENFNALGYQSLSPIQNMGLLVFLAVLYLLAQVAWLIIVVIFPKSMHKKRFVVWLRDNSFGQNFIRFVMESSLEVSVAYILYIRNSNEYVTSVMVTSTLLFAMVVLTPIIHTVYLIRQAKQLQQNEAQIFNLKHDILSLAYEVVFTIRRVALALICTSTQCLGVQMLSVVVVQYLVCVYLGHVRPFDDEQRNNSEILSELLITFFTVLLHCLTNFVVSAEDRYLMGFVFSGFFCAYLLFKITFVFITSTKRSILWLKRWFARRKQRQRVNSKNTQTEVVDSKQPISQHKNLVSCVDEAFKNDQPAQNAIKQQDERKENEVVSSPIQNDRVDKVNPEDLENQSPKLQSNLSFLQKNHSTQQSNLQSKIIRRKYIVQASNIEESFASLEQIGINDSNASSTYQGSRKNQLINAGYQISGGKQGKLGQNEEQVSQSQFAPKNNKRLHLQETQPVRSLYPQHANDSVDLELNDFIWRTNSLDHTAQKHNKLLIDGYEVGGALRC